MGIATKWAARLRRCGDCGKRIAPKRLEAMPNARYCVECQPAHDQRITNTSGMAVMGDMDSEWMGEAAPEMAEA